MPIPSPRSVRTTDQRSGGIELAALGPAPESLASLARRLAATFAHQVNIVNPEIDLSQSYDQRRGQHNALVLLDQLTLMPTAPSVRRLGVIASDLFIPMLTHVFGLAQLGGLAAVVSTHRLSQTVSSNAPQRTQVEQRLAKEAIHELGHAFGLVHCADPACVMRSATDIAEVDLRPTSFCHSCHQALLTKTTV